MYEIDTVNHSLKSWLRRSYCFIFLQSIAAKAGGEPCCDWVGEDGAGHFVKMVHNGIEYGDVQLICEAYQLMKDALGLSHQEMSDVFTEWNKGELDSFLIEITRDILKFKDTDGEFYCSCLLLFIIVSPNILWTGDIDSHYVPTVQDHLHKSLFLS